MVPSLERGISIPNSFSLDRMSNSSPGIEQQQSSCVVVENKSVMPESQSSSQTQESLGGIPVESIRRMSSREPSLISRRQEKQQSGENKSVMPESQSSSQTQDSLGGNPVESIRRMASREPSLISRRKEKQQSDTEMMKDRFTKLLLGEDMSGGGKGVSSALALSNAITNLAASIFGEQTKLQPMAADRRARWKKEIDWLLSVTDHIVEFVPSQQISKDGVCTEIMVTKQRCDLLMNIPALRKLDTMLIDTLDNFRGHNEFWYVSRDSEEGKQAQNERTKDKWWLPPVKVPPNGLSESSRRLLHFQKDSVSQVQKAAMAINAQVLSEMAIPDSYIESLPKNGRASLGDSLYKSITEEWFDPEQFLSTLDLSTEHKMLDVKNRIEASIVIWKRKLHLKDNKSSWSSAVSLEKRELFEDRAQTILLLLKQKFPGLPQSSLDISKIQFNKDVGQAVLESYSRILESLGYTEMSRIEDVLYADSLAQKKCTPEVTSDVTTEINLESARSSNNLGEEPEKLDDPQNSSKTLLDFIGWSENSSKGQSEKPPKSPRLAQKKFSYLEKLENLNGFRSPKDRQ